MDIGKMLSNMNPETLQNGLKQISSMLTPEQAAQAEQAIKNLDKDSLQKNLNSFSAESLKKELESKPQILKNLAKNPELMSKLAEALKKGK